MSAPVPAITIDGVGKRFGQVDAVKDCDLVVERGAFVSLLGPSGCGKTTLLRMIAGFEHQDRGHIRVHGELVDGLPPNKRDVNTVFQRYALFPHKTVYENVVFTLEIMRIPKAQRKDRVREMLALVQLEGMEDRRPSQLSGGQAQRVALARALAGRPEVLLLDEPLAALDLKLRKAMQLELRRIHEEVGTTFLYVTHDQEEALAMSDTIVLMEAGNVVQQGTPVEIYDNPRTVFASQFIGEANLLSGEVVHTENTELVIAANGLKIHCCCTTREIPTGTPVVVSLRPERIVVATTMNGATEAMDNLVEATVRRRVFLGHLVRLIVEVASDITLTVECSTQAAASLEDGSRVTLGWSKDAANVIPANGALV